MGKQTALPAMMMCSNTQELLQKTGIVKVRMKAALLGILIRMQAKRAAVRPVMMP